MKKKYSLKKLDAPRYAYWQASYLSFYSRELYIDVIKRWRGLGILYLIWSLFLCISPFAISISYDLYNYVHHDLFDPIRALPPLQIDQGRLSIDAELPYIIKNQNNDVVVLITPVAEMNDIVHYYPHLSWLITFNQIAFRYPAIHLSLMPDLVFNAHIPIKNTSFTEFKHEYFDGLSWANQENIQHIEWLVPIMSYIAIIFFCFGLYLCFICACALLGQFVAHIFFQYPLTYAQASRILAISSTVPTSLFFTYVCLQGEHRSLSAFLFAVVVIYFCYAVICVRGTQNRFLKV